MLTCWIAWQNDVDFLDRKRWSNDVDLLDRKSWSSDINLLYRMTRCLTSGTTPSGHSTSHCLTINNLLEKRKGLIWSHVKSDPTWRVLWLTENLGGTMPSYSWRASRWNFWVTLRLRVATFRCYSQVLMKDLDQVDTKDVFLTSPGSFTRS